MKKGLIGLTMFALVVVLAACGGENNAAENNLNENEEELDMLEVDFDVPEEAEAGDTVTLEATVAYGDEPVSDASDMEFEVYELGEKEDSDMIDGESDEDGIYTADYTFEEDGVYEMYAHTTAEGMHTMPKERIIVGDASEDDYDEEDIEADEEHDSMDNMD